VSHTAALGGAKDPIAVNQLRPLAAQQLHQY